MPRTPAQSAEVREARKTQILDAALSVYLRCGYHGCDMDMVAQEAQLAKGLLYYYYQTKKALFVHLFQATFSEATALSDALMAQAREMEPVEQLMYYCYGIFKANRSDARLIRFMLRAPFDAAAVFGPEKWAEGSAQSRLHSDAVANMIRRGVEAGAIPAVNARNAANSFWSVFVANLFDYAKLMLGEATAERADFREIVRFCFQGLGIDHDLWTSCLNRVISLDNGGNAQ